MIDLLVIGGGINGAGIARDAARRGLSVMLVEQGDLAEATSSASTKLIHGGLRYLEHYDFKLVRDSLNERERLLRSAPHIIWPMEFIIPHEGHLRPAWLIRLGLYLYDILGQRDLLPGSQGLNFKIHPAGGPLKHSYRKGFSYADCWVEDSRLVVLCAQDAADHGAQILTRTKCIGLKAQGDIWSVRLEDQVNGKAYDVKARGVVNAAGPWVRSLLDDQNLAKDETPGMTLSKGSHIITEKLYEGSQAYLLQQPDGRIVFTIPYEHQYTLIGTTDTAYEGDPSAAQIDEGEIEYLCAAASRSFQTAVTRDQVIWTYSGVRPLLNDGDGELSKVTRDYKLDLENGFGPPLLNIFGGKLTTFRSLSVKAVDKIAPALGYEEESDTAEASLPGGEIEGADFDRFVALQSDRYPFLPPALVYRYARAYGTKMDEMLSCAKTLSDLEHDFRSHVFEAELRYVIANEWVRKAEDFLWRRSKLGLHVSEETRAEIEKKLPQYVKEFESER